MTVTTFEKLMSILRASFTNFKMDPEKDKDAYKIWFGELAYMDDAKSVLAIKKVISTCDFVTIKNIKQAYADVDMPMQIDDEEGWGLVEKAIRNYGYMRAEEAMASLPSQVQKAITYMGGFQSICEAEKKEVIRGQFNKAMGAANARTKINAVLGEPLLTQIGNYQKMAELAERQALQITYQEQEEIQELNEDKIATNKEHIAHIKEVFKKSLERRAAIEAGA